MAVLIASELLAQIVDHAERSPDREVCGLLLGREGEILEVRATANVAERVESAFEIDPAALIAAHKAARGGGPAVLGHYHSHPNGRADPSPRDAAAARPGQLWLIVARGETQLFRAGDGGFAQVALMRR